MAKPLFQAPTGTRDIMAPETDRMRMLVSIFAGSYAGSVILPSGRAKRLALAR